jgi:[acyl-carrier-protein] S-malonyltransferase
MGRALQERSPGARAVFQRADEALGFAVSTLCFEGPELELGLTQFTQPAILTTSIAALEALREAYPELPLPDFVLGHSLGEYTALVAAGALTLEDAVCLVHLRGQAMQDAVRAGSGGMAAVMGGDEEAVRRLCADAAEGDVLAPANYNAPGQIVVAGTARAIARAAALAKERSLKVVILKVSAPFHCELMSTAADRVRQALARIPIGPLRACVVANVDGAPNSDPGRVTELLVRQVDHPVLWDRSIRHVAAAGVTRTLEIGPGKVLAGLVKRIDKALSVFNIATPEDIVRASEFL